ncbi:adenosylcobinamide-phosphate synthase CbiB [Alicyclobacillus ferrooxydans]|uniref:Cobalamin biosynthesis protein CobD n=1 Tax=Alicyclobacillus ferrooxydans TaxID=471514 RepID=A0A0N8PN93_9BACL|nr:adenosylcobinamide-phosphate synthase CbiB [Alicyclobacillus ferrooxydans]KPV40885.1 hypothetical protein AN477_21630 [Alicyclobacillus ferrooxydans]
MNLLFGAALALFVDRMIGDPRFIPHPVVWIGKYITLFDRRLNRAVTSRNVKRALGIFLTLTTVLIASIIPWLFLFLLKRYTTVWVAWTINVFLISTTIAWNGLVKAGWGVLHRLQTEGIEAARREVSMIVGRDTEHLSEAEVVRATVETLAENIVDAIVSPIFYACIGGAPLALLYRAANTLDSMVGYKNERYVDFGWCSAQLDDVLNFIPARLTIGLLWVATWMTKNNAREAIRIMQRDARKHPSPNSGIPESMVAGALGVQLGGVNFYGGIESRRATMGDPSRTLQASDIRRTILIVHVTSIVILVMAGLGGVLVWQL